MSQADLQDDVAAAEAAPGFPTAYVARVRAATRRLDPLPAGPMGVPQAIDMVAQHSRLDVDAPIRSQRRSAKLAKVAVKRATAWYLRYLADQAGDLGQAVAHLGEALASRVDALAGRFDQAEEANGDARRELDDLRRRVAALEAGAQSGAKAPAKAPVKAKPAAPKPGDSAP